MNKTKIEGVSINLDALAAVQNLKDLKATGVFSHMPKDAQREAYGQLWKALKGIAPMEDPAVEE